MALSNPVSVFGVHSLAFFDRTTEEYKGILRVLGSSSLNIGSENILLNGGSNPYPWAVESGLNTAELSITAREYPSFLYELLLGKAASTVSAEATGNVSTIANASGTSVVDATTGIASVAATGSDEADLKFGKYVVVAASATTIDVYVSTNIDFARGTDANYQDDLLKVNSSALTVPGTGGTVALADFGLTFTGGSGTVAMTTGDTATFEVRPINSGGYTVTIGSTSDVFPEFGAIAYAKQGSDGGLFEATMYRVKAAGMPIGFDENAFSEWSVTANAFYDSTRDAVIKIRRILAP